MVKVQTHKMRKFKDEEPFGLPDERKGYSEEPFVGNSDNRKGSFNSNETLCLLGI
jgi:hypothetical protein